MISREEKLLIGHWLATESGVTGDAACQRIAFLVASYLVEVARTSDGWSTLYKDPNDDRLWQHTYPQGELHGGGPPALECISPAQAKAIYGVVA